MTDGLSSDLERGIALAWDRLNAARADRGESTGYVGGEEQARVLELAVSGSGLDAAELERAAANLAANTLAVIAEAPPEALPAILKMAVLVGILGARLEPTITEDHHAN